MSGYARLAMLLRGPSARVLRMAIRCRYIALAVAVNTPGNAVIRHLCASLRGASNGFGTVSAVPDVGQPPVVTRGNARSAPSTGGYRTQTHPFG